MSRDTHADEADPLLELWTTLTRPESAAAIAFVGGLIGLSSARQQIPTHPVWSLLSFPGDCEPSVSRRLQTRRRTPRPGRSRGQCYGGRLPWQCQSPRRLRCPRLVLVAVSCRDDSKVRAGAAMQEFPEDVKECRLRHWFGGRGPSAMISAAHANTAWLTAQSRLPR
jgi:hypothetical protein